MRNGAASELLTNSFSGGTTQSMIHIRHYEENDEFTAVSRVLSSACHKRLRVFPTSKISREVNHANDNTLLMPYC